MNPFLPLRKAGFSGMKSEAILFLAAHCGKFLLVLHVGRGLVPPLLEIVFKFLLNVHSVSRKTNVDSYVSLVDSTVDIRNMNFKVHFVGKYRNQRIF